MKIITMTCHDETEEGGEILWQEGIHELIDEGNHAFTNRAVEAIGRLQRYLNHQS